MLLEAALNLGDERGVAGARLRVERRDPRGLGFDAALDLGDERGVPRARLRVERRRVACVRFDAGPDFTDERAVPRARLFVEGGGAARVVLDAASNLGDERGVAGARLRVESFGARRGGGEESIDRPALRVRGRLSGFPSRLDRRDDRLELLGERERARVGALDPLARCLDRPSGGAREIARGARERGVARFSARGRRGPPGLGASAPRSSRGSRASSCAPRRRPRGG